MRTFLKAYVIVRTLLQEALEDVPWFVVCIIVIISASITLNATRQAWALITLFVIHSAAVVWCVVEHNYKDLFK